MTRGICAVIAGAVLAVQTGASAAEVHFSPMSGARMTATVQSLFEQRWEHVARQSLDVSCGSAALATILRAQYGDGVTEEEIIRAILERVAQKDVARRGGFTLLDLKRVAMSMGYTVHGYKLSFDELRELDTPALVPISIRGYKHFVVYRGAVGGRVFLSDPAFGNLVVRDFLFEAMWDDIVLVIGQRPGGPVPARLSITGSEAGALGTQDALRTFMQQGGFPLEFSPDEF